MLTLCQHRHLAPHYPKRGQLKPRNAHPPQVQSCWCLGSRAGRKHGPPFGPEKNAMISEARFSRKAQTSSRFRWPDHDHPPGSGDNLSPRLWGLSNPPTGLRPALDPALNRRADGRLSLVLTKSQKAGSVRSLRIGCLHPNLQNCWRSARRNGCKGSAAMQSGDF